MDTNNCLNKFFLSFNRLYKELLSRFWLVDNFSDPFSFHTINHKDTEVKNAYLYTLDKIFDNSLSNLNTILIISDTSIKNNVATLILHIHSGQNILAKTIHYTINVTSTKVELFSIRCEINQAVQVPNAENIIIITDAIHGARYIFDLSSHPYQLHSVTNFIQFVSLQSVDWFSQAKLCCKAPNEGYLHIYGMYKSNNKQPRYQVINNCKSFVC